MTCAAQSIERRVPATRGGVLRRVRAVDLVVAIVLAVTAATGSLLGSHAMPQGLVTLRDANDTWFEADTPRVAESMAHHPGMYSLRYLLHPLFSELTYPFAFVLRGGLGMSFETAVRTMVAGAAALWIAGIFALLRGVGLKLLDAALLTGLAGVTASAMCWLIVPETHAMGSLSIIAAMLLVIVATHRRRTGLRREPVGWHVALGVLTYGFTISNGMASLAATWVSRRRRWGEIAAAAVVLTFSAAMVEPVVRKGLQRVADLSTGATQMIAVVLLVLGMVTLLALLRTRVARRGWVWARRWLNRPGMVAIVLAGGAIVVIAALAADRQFIATDYAGPAWRSASSFVYHTVALPALSASDRYGRGWETIYTQQSLPGSAGPWGVAAVVLWTALLGMGLATVWRRWGETPVLRAALLVLAGQFLLHLFYGEEVFLYSMNWTPLLILVAGVPLLERRFAIPARVLAVGLIVCLLMNNIPQLRAAIAHVAALPVNG